MRDEGRIDYIDNRMDTTSGTIRVRGVFANPEGALLPGLYARVKIPAGQDKDELLVPDTALSRDQQGYFLLTADKENKVRYQPVTTGPKVDNMRVVRQGILPTDRVIINGIQKARPGSPVTVMEEKISMAVSKSDSPSA